MASHRLRASVLAAAAVVITVAGAAHGEVGAPITDIRVLDNQRTQEDTVRSVAGVKIGESLESTTLDSVRERLKSAGLFSDVNVWWEPHRGGVRINIAVKDKFPWAPVPTFSWSANNKAAGLLFVHGNLFGRGKQLLVGGRLATVDSGASLAYRDPSFLGTWIYWQLLGTVQRQVIPEFDNDMPVPDAAFRETRMESYGIEPAIGIAWFRRVKTQIAWRMEQVNVLGSFNPTPDPVTMEKLPFDGPVASQSARIGVGRAVLTFDFRARDLAVMTGTALSGALDYAGPFFRSDLTYARLGASFEQGIRFFRTHNLIYSAGAAAGRDLPFWGENTAGGPNLRGYLYQQYRGDTQLWGKVEYHFPLFSVGPLDFRALGFYDGSALYFRSLPEQTDPDAAFVQRPTPDARTFPSQIEKGFLLERDVHNAVGAGLRFFIRSVAVPLVGIDAGYGIEAKHWRFFLIVGA
jgi:outer membrane protein assembly factor BamA